MKPPKADGTILRRTAIEARPYWPHILGIFLLNLRSTPLTLLTPVPFKIMVDSVIGSYFNSAGADARMKGCLDRRICEGLIWVMVYTDLRTSNCFVGGAL